MPKLISLKLELCHMPWDQRLKRNWEDFRMKVVSEELPLYPSQRKIDVVITKLQRPSGATSWAVALTLHWRHLWKACLLAEILKDWPSSSIPPTGLDFQPFWEFSYLSSSELDHWSVVLVCEVTSAFYANHYAGWRHGENKIKHIQSY